MSTPSPTSTALLPASDEVEQALLGAILIDPGIVSVVAGEIPSEAVFYTPRNRLIYRAFCKLRERREDIDLRTLQAQLEAAGDFATIGGMAYLAGLDLSLPSSVPAAVSRYVKILLDRWAKRELVEASVRLRSEAMNGNASTDVIALATGELERISKSICGGGEAKTVSESLATYDAYRPPEDVQPGTETGFGDLDRMTGGLCPGDLMVVAARPSVGKSAFALQVAYNVAKADGSVKYHALEMSVDAMRNRLLAQLSGVDSRKIRSCRLSDHERWRISFAADELYVSGIGERLLIDPTPGLSIGQIQAAASVQKLRSGLDMLIIDSLNRMRYVGRERDRRLVLGEICSACKDAATELGIPVILVHHVSRGHEGEGRPPTMRDLSDSALIEAHASVIMLLWRPEMYMDSKSDDYEKHKGMAYGIMAKIREGEVGRVDMCFDGPSVSFKSLDWKRKEPF